MINTRLYTLDEAKNENTIKEIAKILQEGGLAVIPTETVYGLAADGLNSQAVEKIFKAKGRPQDNPLIMHISNFEMIYEIASVVPETAIKLASKFWPGPFTMILPKKDIVPQVTSGGLNSVAIRMPSHPIARKIIEAARTPLAAPSANISGKPSPTSFSHCVEDMKGKADAIIDGGDCDFGVESTVVSLLGDVPVLLRPGAITPEQIRDVIGKLDIAQAVTDKLENDEKVLSPGMKYKHYSPNAKVFIVKGSFEKYKNFIENLNEDGIYGLVFTGESSRLAVNSLEYGDEKSSLEQAHNLFFKLRELDEKNARIVYARLPLQDGVGLAVYNRLIRAAAFEIIDLEE
ncbi:MAG: L-threonylcarbamoyladenylate synthase [Oscillospiraceae bacterium]